MDKEVLKDIEMGKVTGGLSQKEFIDYLNNFWQMIPEDIRNKIVNTYVTAGKAATYKLIKCYIEQSHMDYLSPLLDMLK